MRLDERILQIASSVMCDVEFVVEYSSILSQTEDIPSNYNPFADQL
jgi:hypothetical protein